MKEVSTLRKKGFFEIISEKVRCLHIFEGLNLLSPTQVGVDRGLSVLRLLPTKSICSWVTFFVLPHNVNNELQKATRNLSCCNNKKFFAEICPPTSKECYVGMIGAGLGRQVGDLAIGLTSVGYLGKQYSINVQRLLGAL